MAVVAVCSYCRYATLLSAALSKDSASDAAAARKDLAHIFSTGPIDSVDQWDALSSGGAKDGPRKEVLLAGIDSDKRGKHQSTG